jgi:hypothetical protein
MVLGDELSSLASSLTVICGNIFIKRRISVLRALDDKPARFSMPFSMPSAVLAPFSMPFSMPFRYFGTVFYASHTCVYNNLYSILVFHLLLSKIDFNFIAILF